MQRADDVLSIFGGDAAPNIRKVTLVAEEAGEDRCFRQVGTDLIAAQTDVTERLRRDPYYADGVRMKAVERLQDVRSGGISGDDADDGSRGENVGRKLAGDLVG